MSESLIIKLPLALLLYGTALFFCLFERRYRATRGVFFLLSAALARVSSSSLPALFSVALEQADSSSTAAVSRTVIFFTKNTAPFCCTGLPPRGVQAHYTGGRGGFGLLAADICNFF